MTYLLLLSQLSLVAHAHPEVDVTHMTVAPTILDFGVVLQGASLEPRTLDIGHDDPFLEPRLQVVVADPSVFVSEGDPYEGQPLPRNTSVHHPISFVAEEPGWYRVPMHTIFTAPDYCTSVQTMAYAAAVASRVEMSKTTLALRAQGQDWTGSVELVNEGLAIEELDVAVVGGTLDVEPGTVVLMPNERAVLVVLGDPQDGVASLTVTGPGVALEVDIVVADETEAFADVDADGVAAAEGDCADQDADVGTHMSEVLDGVDQDCDGVVDEYLVDVDGDGFKTEEGDCDDRSGFVYPGALEWFDHIDSDCDGVDWDWSANNDALWGLSDPCDLVETHNHGCSCDTSDMGSGGAGALLLVFMIGVSGRRSGPASKPSQRVCDS